MSLLHSRSGQLTVVIILIGVALNIVQAWQNSPTSDEPGHLVSGVTQWRDGNFSYNTPHPPLTKLLAAIPVLFQPDTTVRFKNDAGKKFSDLDAANDFLYRNFMDILILLSMFEKLFCFLRYETMNV